MKLDADDSDQGAGEEASKGEQMEEHMSVRDAVNAATEAEAAKQVSKRKNEDSETEEKKKPKNGPQEPVSGKT